MNKFVYLDCEFLSNKTGYKQGTKSSILKELAEKMEKEGTIKILSKPKISEIASKPSNQIEEVDEQEEKAIESSPVDKMVNEAPKNKMVSSSPKNKYKK